MVTLVGIEPDIDWLKISHPEPLEDRAIMSIIYGGAMGPFFISEPQSIS